MRRADRASERIGQTMKDSVLEMIVDGMSAFIAMSSQEETYDLREILHDLG